MKIFSVLITLIVLQVSLSASAEITNAAVYTAAFPFCDTATIGEAIKRSMDAAVMKARGICEAHQIDQSRDNLIVHSVRILDLSPIDCNGWSAGFRPVAEISFECIP